MYLWYMLEAGNQKEDEMAELGGRQENKEDLGGGGRGWGG